MFTGDMKRKEGPGDFVESKLWRLKLTCLPVTHSSLLIFILNHTLRVGPACVLLFFSQCSLSSSTLSLLFFDIWPAFSAVNSICLRHKKLSSIRCSEKLCGFADDLLSGGIQYISSSHTILPAMETQCIRSYETMLCNAFQATLTCSKSDGGCS